jgi:hypothetical protein
MGKTRVRQQEKSRKNPATTPSTIASPIPTTKEEAAAIEDVTLNNLFPGPDFAGLLEKAKAVRNGNVFCYICTRVSCHLVYVSPENRKTEPRGSIFRLDRDGVALL